MLVIVGVKHRSDHVAHVEDRAVDVRQEHELLTGEPLGRLLVVSRERFHPVSRHNHWP